MVPDDHFCLIPPNKKWKERRGGREEVVASRKPEKWPKGKWKEGGKKGNLENGGEGRERGKGGINSIPGWPPTENS